MFRCRDFEVTVVATCELPLVANVAASRSRVHISHIFYCVHERVLVLLWYQDVLRTNTHLARVKAAAPQDSLGGKLKVSLGVENDRVHPYIEC